MYASENASGLFAALWITAGANHLFDASYAGAVCATLLNDEGRRENRQGDSTSNITRQDGLIVGQCLLDQRVQPSQSNCSFQVH